MPVEDVPSAESRQSEELASYNCWRFDAHNLEIFIHPVLYRATVNAVLVASRGKRPSEIGGVLWGTAATQKSPRSIVISEIIGVGSENPLFNTTFKDAAALQATVQNSVGVEDMQLVGYFRSHMREGATVSPQDKKFFEKHLGGAPGVFLVMKPAGNASWAPHVYVWNSETLQLDAAEVASQSASADPLTGKMVAGPAPKPPMTGSQMPARQQKSQRYLGNALPGNVASQFAAPEDSPDTLAGGRSEGSPSAPWFQRHLPVIALLVIACVAGFFGRPLVQTYLHGITARSESTLIGLHVDRGPGGQLNLSWNRNLPGLSPQQTATLTIQDGPFHRNVSIDSEQLRFGRLTYFAETDDVQFHLEIALGEDRSLTENLHVVAPGGAMGFLSSSSLSSSTREQEIVPGRRSLNRGARVPETLERAGLGAAGPLATTKPVDFGLDGGKISPPTNGFEATGDASASSTNLTRKNLEVSSRSYSLPSYSAPDIARVASPAIAWNNNAQTFEIRNNLPDQTPPPPAEANPAPVSAPIQPRRTALSRVPPRPLRQILPDTREFGTSLLRDAVNLEVEVAINEKGRVVSAHSLPAKGANAFLAAQAVAAAKQWTFEPARLGGEPVSSVYTIRFEFRP